MDISVISVISVILSALAIIVTIIVAVSEWKSRQTQTQLGNRQAKLAEDQARINNRLLDIEETREARTELSLRRAVLVGTIYESRPLDYRVRIQNVSGSTARNVRLLLDGKELREHAAYCGQDLNEELTAGSEDEVHLLITKKTKLRKAELQWEDNSGEPGKTLIAVAG